MIFAGRESTFATRFALGFLTFLATVLLGGFAASGILQPLVGWVVDDGAGYAAGGSGDAYWLGIAVIVGWMLIGVYAATRLTETHCRNVWQPAGVMR